MALRDRLTVRTIDGSVTGLTVEKNGGSIDINWPSKSNPWLHAIVLDKNDNPTFEELRVPEERVVYAYTDRAPKPQKKTRTRVPKEPAGEE